MKTKGIEEMSREELIELVNSLQAELEKEKKDSAMYRECWKDLRESCLKAEQKIKAMKAFVAVL